MESIRDAKSFAPVYIGSTDISKCDFDFKFKTALRESGLLLVQESDADASVRVNITELRQRPRHNNDWKISYSVDVARSGDQKVLTTIKGGDSAGTPADACAVAAKNVAKQLGVRVAKQEKS